MTKPRSRKSPMMNREVNAALRLLMRLRDRGWRGGSASLHRPVQINLPNQKVEAQINIHVSPQTITVMVQMGPHLDRAAIDSIENVLRPFGFRSVPLVRAHVGTWLGLAVSRIGSLNKLLSRTCLVLAKVGTLSTIRQLKAQPKAKLRPLSPRAFDEALHWCCRASRTRGWTVDAIGRDRVERVRINGSSWST